MKLVEDYIDNKVRRYIVIVECDSGIRIGIGIGDHQNRRQQYQ